MKIPISILEKELPEYKSRLDVYRVLQKSHKPKTKQQQSYYNNLIRGCEQEIGQIEMAIEILSNHSK